MPTTSPAEPTIKRCVAFVDGQNLFNAAKEAFGYSYPNYDVLSLSKAICLQQSWKLTDTMFYTGIPVYQQDRKRHMFWSRKLRAMARQGVKTFSRNLRYRTKIISLDDGTSRPYDYAEEKGVDVRIAIDVMRMAYKKEFDVALIFSQDQDLSEATSEIRRLQREQGRWIKVACAYPVGPSTKNRRGINHTDWIPIESHIVR